MAHRWTVDDDLVALYLYLYSSNLLIKNPQQISIKLGITYDSLMMRVANFKACDTNGGLGHVAQQTQNVYDNYRRAPMNQTQFALLVNNIIKL